MDLNASLADGELVEGAPAGRDSKDVANAIDEFGVRVPAEDDNVSPHVVVALPSRCRRVVVALPPQLVVSPVYLVVREALEAGGAN